MKVKSLRAIRIASLSGHIINIPANKAVEIPDVLKEEAFTRGCVPCDNDGNISIDTSSEEKIAEETALENERRAAADSGAKGPADTEAVVETVADAPATAGVDAGELFSAFAQLIDEGDESKFSKITKAPKVGPVSDLIGKKVSAEVVDAAWGVYTEE